MIKSHMPLRLYWQISQLPQPGQPQDLPLPLEHRQWLLNLLLPLGLLSRK